MNNLPAVEMLWESTDPHEELTDRFGFSDGAAAADWVADILGRYWELDVDADVIHRGLVHGIPQLVPG